MGEGATQERWGRVQSLFERVVDLDDAARAAVLEAECAGDDELRREVLSLVESDQGAAASMRRAIAGGIGALAAAAHVGARVGPYRLIDVIGEGGMGVVYKGERVDGQYKGKVAVKILRAGFASKEARARFRDERQILAALDHPGIVKLLDGGTTEDGLPYLVMEHIDGVPLAAHGRALSVRARVELVVKLARAVQYAHQRLVVHRDLKPSNVLVAKDGAPKLLDFGIAKLLAPTEDLAREAETRTGMALLTFEYASPEQARGEGVTVATDVYSLGAVLYELLVGKPPQRAGADALETLRNVCEVDPPRPSVVAPPEVRAELAGDLDNIVARALQKKPADRYATVGDLADDLERYLTGHAVRAREATIGYRVKKLVARNRGAFAVAALVAIALSAATVVSILQARRAARQNRILLVEQGSQELERGDYMRAIPYLLEAMRQGEDNAATRFLVARAMKPLRRKVVAFDQPEGFVSMGVSHDGAFVVVSGPTGVRVFRDDGSPTGFSVPGHCGAMLAPAGRLILLCDGELALYDTASGARLRRMAWSGGQVASIYPSPTANLAVLAVAAGLVMCDLDAGSCHPVPGKAACAFTPDGSVLATADVRGVVHMLSPATGEPRFELHANDDDVVELLFTSADRLFVGTHDGSLVLLDVPTQSVISTHHGWRVGLERSPDGKSILSGGDDDSVRISDAQTGEPVSVMVGHDRRLRNMRWSADSQRVVTTGFDNTFRVWDGRTRTAEMVLETVAASGAQGGSMGGALGAAFSRDGRRIITASATELAWWDAGPGALLETVEAPAQLYAASYAPDEKSVALVGSPGFVALYDLERHAMAWERKIGDGFVYDAQWSPDGARFAVAGVDGLARVHRAVDGTVDLDLHGHTGTVNRITFSRDGSRIITAGSDKTIRAWDAKTGAELGKIERASSASAVALSRDGRTLVSATWGGDLELWDAVSLRPISTIATGRQLLDASLSPDGTRIATAGHGGEIEIWDVADRKRLLTCEGHQGPATIVAWSPDGQLLASSADDQTARIWDPTTCKRLAKLEHRGGTMQVMWTHDGRRLLVTDHDHRFTIWDVARDERSLAELDAVATKDVPWRLVDGRLQLR